MNTTTRYTPETLQPIYPPAGWTREQDLEHFRDRRLEDCAPGDEQIGALNSFSFHAANLNDAIDEVIDRALAGQPASRAAAEQLPPRLRVAVAVLSRRPAVVAARLDEALQVAGFALDEAQGILARVATDKPNRVTLYEIGEAADWLGTAANQISEALLDWPLGNEERQPAASVR